MSQCRTLFTDRIPGFCMSVYEFYISLHIAKQTEQGKWIHFEDDQSDKKRIYRTGGFYCPIIAPKTGL